jgi:hypothetical protein
VGWLYQKLGGTPIQRGKVDRQGLKSARHLFSQGQFPLAAAPEGANNGHTEIVSPLEPGIAQFGFWCWEDLQKGQPLGNGGDLPSGDSLSVPHPTLDCDRRIIDPVRAGLWVEYCRRPRAAPHGSPNPLRGAGAVPRLVGLGMHLLTLMEGYYADFYQAPPPPQPQAADDEATVNEAIAIRLQTLLDTALTVAESFFQLPAKGSVIDRCRRIEQAGWDWIYRDELRDRAHLSPVEQGLADRIAEEASLRMWHMRLVESFVAVTGQYVREKPTVERFAETLLLLRDTLVLIKGKIPFRARAWGLRWPICRWARRCPSAIAVRPIVKAAVKLLQT